MLNDALCRISGILLTMTLGTLPALAEQADYGQIELNGLARDVSWPLNPPGEGYAMVCNVNGEDGFLSIRTGPGADHPVARSLKRLARVHIDTRERRGHWVRVTGASRSFSIEGKRQPDQALPVTGWAHDGHLCSYIDYPAPGEMEDALGLAEERERPAKSEPRSAQCEWDNGTDGEVERYACQFVACNGDGSFSAMRADGYDLNLTIERPGVGTVVEFLDGRRGLEFGRFVRDDKDPACWEAEEGAERLCVR